MAKNDEFQSDGFIVRLSRSLKVNFEYFPFKPSSIVS